MPKWRHTQLIDASMGIMECTRCGRRWAANLKSGGHYYKGSWKCPSGCSDKPLKKK